VTEKLSETRTVIVERDIPFPPERIWRALTQPHLIEEWLMKTDFMPAVGHAFRLSADWGEIECKVLTVELHSSLSYSWAAHGLESVVVWTLTPTPQGTRLRMEQEGFRPDQGRAYGGARTGWPRFLAALERLLARMDGAASDAGGSV
jgi:uncharacterized protein YndB with AHSA1/START domain